MLRCNFMYFGYTLATVFVLIQIFLMVSVCYHSTISKQSQKVSGLDSGNLVSTEKLDFIEEKLSDLSQPEDNILRKQSIVDSVFHSDLESLKNNLDNQVKNVLAYTLNERNDESKTNSSTGYLSKNNGTSLDVSWNNESFCQNFLVKTFQTPISVCANEKESAVHCFGTPFSKEMGTCILENILVNPGHLAEAMEDADSPNFNRHRPSIALLSDRGLGCQNISTAQLQKHIESNDYVRKIIDHMKHVNPLSSQACNQWVEEDAFFFTANKVHIYFRFLDYFNLHKILVDFQTLRPQVIRISGSIGYNFPEFDQKLFSEVNFKTLDSLSNGSVCFKKVTLIPKSYASFLFRCKMSPILKTKCFRCSGKGLSKTQVLTFRARVLKACLLNDKLSYHANLSIIFVSRKPYYRFVSDRVDRFQRVMDNEDSLIAHLQDSLKSCAVRKVNLENLGICEQVELAHNADIFLGVHGAGLVHLWWLRDNAVIYELEPSYERNNPTFKLLARLTLRKYMMSRIAGGASGVHANVNSIVSKIQGQIVKRKHLQERHGFSILHG